MCFLTQAIRDALDRERHRVSLSIRGFKIRGRVSIDPGSLFQGSVSLLVERPPCILEVIEYPLAFVQEAAEGLQPLECEAPLDSSTGSICCPVVLF